MSKRPAIVDYFSPKTKFAKSEDGAPRTVDYHSHPTYPIRLPSRFPFELRLNTDSKKRLNSLQDLDLWHYSPLLPSSVARELFEFLRAEFCWYRVTYQARGITINTPRFTTVFGLDETHIFAGSNERGPVFERTSKAPPKKSLNCQPRPMPGCLIQLKQAIEAETKEQFNFCLLNYYKDGNDSISYHSDDENFLGPLPTIVSISLGADRDFLMRLKNDHAVNWKTKLRSGDCVIMQGTTQSCWDHAIPKRKGGNSPGGRINITFRKACVRAGTENYYRYNVNNGPYFRWDPAAMEMVDGLQFEKDKQKSKKVVERGVKAEIDFHEAVVPKSSSDVSSVPLISEESFDVEAAVKAIEQVYHRPDHHE